MPLHLRNPIAFFDLETTGVSVTQDRIVEVAVIKASPNGEHTIFQKRVNPEIPIPTEASSVHGIYDKDIQDAPTFKKIAKELIHFLHGCDLAGFNILRFDIPILAESFLRADVEFSIDHHKVVDVQKIFHLMEKRDLITAYQFYCNKELKNAHNALEDARATMEVLHAQVDRYDGRNITDNNGKALGKITSDIESLHTITAADTFIDYAGRMIYNDQKVPAFNFGKYKGKTVQQVLRRDPAYFDWIMKSDFALDTKRKLTQIKLSLKDQLS